MASHRWTKASVIAICVLGVVTAAVLTASAWPKGDLEGRLFSDDPERSAAAAEKLADAGSERAAAAVRRTLQRAEPGAACRMITALGRRRRSSDLPALRRCVLDARPKVRAAAVAAIGQLGEKGDPGLVQGALEADAAPAVRVEAAKALGYMEHWDSTPALIDALGDRSLRVRRQAAAAIRRILKVDFKYRADAPPAQRQAAIVKIRAYWPRFQQMRPRYRSQARKVNSP